jgi:hypothetical protein
MRALVLPLALGLTLSACHKKEPESVEAQAANASGAIEQRYNELQAEASNDVAGAAAPVENEADALLNQMNGSAPAADEAEPARNGR